MSFLWRWFLACWYGVTGRFEAAREALMEDKYVMGNTYDRAIEKNTERFSTVKNAVAELVMLEQQGVQAMKALGDKISHFNKAKQGAQLAMQKRIDALKAQGKTRAEIEGDAEFVRHLGAFNDVSSSLDTAKASFDEKDAEVALRRKQIGQYKTELQGMQRASESLVSEKQEALADVAIAQQAEQINSMLAGLSNDTADQDLADARKARNRAKARATVVSELAGNDAKTAENEYLSYANEAASNAQLDNILNWGEEASSENLSPAKLPE